MSIGVIQTFGTSTFLFDHCEDGMMRGFNETAHGLYHETPMTFIPNTDIPQAGTTKEIVNLIQNPGLLQAFRDNMGFSQTPIVSELCTFFNGEEFSEWIEISLSRRFMTGDVGPAVGPTMGLGFKVDITVSEAIPQITRLQDFLKQIGYKGQILIGLGEGFQAVGCLFGHEYGSFALFSEICETSTSGIMDFIFGLTKDCVLYDSGTMGNLVSLAPFPYPNPAGMQRLRTTKSAEKHLWRMELQSKNEVALATVHGRSLQECRSRMKRTISNLLHYSPELQYRTDYGFHRSFILSQEKHESFMDRERATPEPQGSGHSES